MKKKILSLILAVVLFIPMSIVKASDITIDQIVARLNENIASGDSFLSKMGENATAEKFGSNSSNIIRVYVSADPDDFYNNYEGNADNFKFFMEYKYEDSTLSAVNYTLYGVTDGTTTENFDYNDIESIDVLGDYMNAAIKDMIYVAFNIKTNNEYTYIHNYLVEGGVETRDGKLNTSFINPPAGISVQTILNELAYSVNLDEIEMLQNEGATNTNPTAYTYEDGDYTISFTDVAGRTHYFTVNSFMYSYDYERAHATSQEDLDNYEETLQKMKDFFKEDGNFIDMYLMNVMTGVPFEPVDGFTLKIKMTDEMKKYDTLKLFTVTNYSSENPIKGTAIELTKDGDYLVGKLPTLGYIALVGSNTTVENPKTGLSTYGTAGLIAIIALGGAYMVCKKKMSN